DRLPAAFAGDVAVKPRALLIVLHVVDDVGELLQPHRRAVAVSHDQFSIVGRLGELPVGQNVEGLMWPVESSGRDVDVPALKSGLNVVDADVAGGQFVGVHL